MDSVRTTASSADRTAGGERADRAPPRAWLAAFIGYLLVYGLWQASSLGGSYRSTIADVAFLPVVLAAIVASHGAARRTSPGRTASAWRLIEIALIAYALGDCAQAVYETSGEAAPNPSLMDPLYLAFYPLFFAGLLRFPTARAGKSANARVLLDAITVGAAGAAVLWYVVLGPTATATTESALEGIISTAYPAGDLILIAGLANLLVRVGHRGSMRSLVLLTAGVAMFLVADVIYVRMELDGAYSGEGVLNMVYLVATGVFALAAASQGAIAPRLQAAEAAQPSSDDRRWEEHEANRPGWRGLSALPYVGVAVVLALLVKTQSGDRFFPDLSLTVTATAIVLLVLFRQLLASRELNAAHEELRAAHVRLAALATTDPLTELPNHGALVDAIDTEMERSRRYEHTCALLFVDIDYFKELNDNHGHAVGDQALREIGGVIDEALRTIDTVGRWGGEEFVVVLPEIDPDGALAAAERIRQSIAEHPFGEQDEAHLTVSIGVAAYPRDGTSRPRLLDAADHAMYAAKRMGRNQCFSAADPVVDALGSSADEVAGLDEHVILSAVDALATLVEARDAASEGHADSVASLAQKLALALGCSAEQARRTYLAARLHDIGKVAVADAILRKPGKLSEEEWRLMREHPAVGAEVVARIGALASLAPIIRSHHERYDGRGYPDGLKGSEIPLEARIVGAVDAFDAMTSDRPYRGRMRLEEAREEMHKCAGTQFDPEVIEALDRALGTNAERSRANAAAPSRRARQSV